MDTVSINRTAMTPIRGAHFFKHDAFTDILSSLRQTNAR